MIFFLDIFGSTCILFFCILKRFFLLLYFLCFLYSMRNYHFIYFFFFFFLCNIVYSRLLMFSVILCSPLFLMPDDHVSENSWMHWKQACCAGCRRKPSPQLFQSFFFPIKDIATFRLNLPRGQFI